jgi:hypothetical protein
VVCAGFEDRATEILRRVVTSGAHGFQVLCVEYLPALVGNRRAEVEELCARAGASLALYTYDREGPAGAAERLMNGIPDNTMLYIDISGMWVEILYTEATVYPSSREEVDAQLEDPADPLGVVMFLS